MQQVVILDTGYASYEYESSLFKNAGYELTMYDGPQGDDNLKYAFAREASISDIASSANNASSLCRLISILLISKADFVAINFPSLTRIAYR